MVNELDEHIGSVTSQLLLRVALVSASRGGLKITLDSCLWFSLTISSLDIAIARRSRALPISITDWEFEFVIVAAASRGPWQVDFFGRMNGEISDPTPVFIRYTIVRKVLAPELPIRVELVPSEQALDHLWSCFMSLLYFSFGCWQIVCIGTKWDERDCKICIFAVSSLPGRETIFS